MFEPLSKTKALRYTKLDCTGAAISDNTADHAITRDNATNLDWLLAPVGGKELNLAAAIAACAKLDTAGSKEWRLPTRFELESTLDLERHHPAVNPDAFPLTKSDWYWSSSPDASDPDFAWFVDFSYGGVGLSRRDDKAFVRAVRSVPASQ